MKFIRNRYLLLVDVVLLAIAPLLLFALRFEGLHWPPNQIHNVIVFTSVMIPARILVYYLFGIYRTMWRYASIAELELVVIAGVSGSVVATILGASLLPGIAAITSRIPLSVLFNGGVLSVVLLAAPRFSIRMRGWHSMRRGLEDSPNRVLIVGAGAAGQMILKELSINPRLGMLAVGFVDDDRSKKGLRIGKVSVFGTLAAMPSVIKKQGITEVVIAMPSAPGSVVRDIVQTALKCGVKARTVPTLGELLGGQISVTALRPVEIQDLLRREPIRTDLRQVAQLAHDRTVLVTGAGGSIGSELCRQIAVLGPARLVVLGHGENPIFDILYELRRAHPSLDIVPVIADIRDTRRVREVFHAHRPYAVFHAAAHKHVPLMESNVVEAVTNNVLGSKNIVDTAIETGVKHFVFISTDKAVRPTNVMGASKRVAEHIVRRAALKHNVNFVAVRFGNVLGSRGSVIPTFVSQIREGGPVTVTHPDMRRFFMTIPEAVQLVLQAGALGKGGELFMLDMGEPVRVVDLARDLIRLSGLKEGDDIEIKFTGIRPGEKLYEEMFFSDELAERTEHPKVLRARKEHMESWGDHLIDQLIQSACEGASADDLRAMLKVIVPDFSDSQPAPMLPTPERGVGAIASVNQGGRPSGPGKKSG
ncbi:MAG: polysaccharide biosynthesis protein [Gemmatimonadaceae bacterium]